MMLLFPCQANAFTHIPDPSKLDFVDFPFIARSQRKRECPELVFRNHGMANYQIAEVSVYKRVN